MPRRLSVAAQSAEAAAIHGSLLVIGELLRNTGDYMDAQFENTCRIVVAYKTHRVLVRSCLRALLLSFVVVVFVLAGQSRTLGIVWSGKRLRR